MKTLRFILGVSALLFLTGCVPSLRQTVVDVRAPIPQVDVDRAYRAIALAFLDKGFDIKAKDSDLRIITTEYKKYESVSGSPPSDFYLQIKAAVRDVPGRGGEISLWPKVKEQNRLNQNAFTEHPFIAYTPKELANITDRNKRSEAMQKAHLIFESVIKAVTDTLGTAPGSFTPTMGTIEVHIHHLDNEKNNLE